MSDKRLLYRVILKILGMIGIVALFLVFFNASFYSNIQTHEAKLNADDVAVDLGDLAFGSNAVVRWNNQRVGILKRTRSNLLDLVNKMSKKPDAKLNEINAHPWRSLDPQYFIYYDIGDSGYCPLFVENKEGVVSFKDTCSSNWFDSQGRFKSDGTVGLQIPPHHFSDDNQLLIGRWLVE